jgi:hypothetical protein
MKLLGTVLLVLVCSVGAFLSPISCISDSRRVKIPVQVRSAGKEWREQQTFVVLLEKKNSHEESDETKSSLSSSSVFDSFKKRPGTLIALPFVLLFGLDLVLNIAVLTKRSFEYFVLGQAPNANPWW